MLGQQTVCKSLSQIVGWSVRFDFLKLALTNSHFSNGKHLPGILFFSTIQDCLSIEFNDRFLVSRLC